MKMETKQFKTMGFSVKAMLVEGHNFSSKELASFNFMVAVIICSDFGAQKNKV